MIMDPSQLAHVIQTISSRLATTIGLTEYLTDDLKDQILENIINHLIVQRILITPLQIVRATHFINRLLTKHQENIIVLNKMDLSQDTYIVITNLICIHLTQHGRQILTNIDKHRITSAIIIILANNRIIRNMIDLNYARNYIQSNLEHHQELQREHGIDFALRFHSI